ncbi:ATP-binding response regulator [Arenicella xantha]|uniref:histidine kinase n=1 Tax=Arenicella xantha TaxID=644221 RepID=A0A395JR91_9GAMM|nr:HAMP domain-containing sensor histidine kinase [Arenicella xantha]RBP51220.1 signal transduction histidine kinase [Arenicella xantha]
MSGIELRTEQPMPRSLEQEFLILSRNNVRRNPVPVFIGMIVIAVAALGASPAIWVFTWLATSVLALFGRAWFINKILSSNAYDDPRRLRWIYWLSFGNTFILCLSLAFFPAMSVIDSVLVTLVMGYLVIGVVITNAGFAKATAPYVTIVLISLAIMWSLFPPLEGTGVWKVYVLSAFILFMNYALLSISKEIHQLFRSSIEMRQKYADINHRLSESLGESQAANAAKTRFLAAASHDLRQPVHTLSLLTAALISRNAASENKDERITDITSTMDKALHSLAVQLDSLLDISKLDAGIVTPNFGNTDVTAILRRLKNEFLPFANEKQLSIQLDIPDSAPAYTDATLLERLLRNLLANSIKYTETGSILLSVNCDDDVLISVKDTGIGIAQDQQKLVFEEFYQIDNPHRDRSKGLGLGLSIVSRLCTLLDIRLTLQSSVGQGSEFSLHLSRGTAMVSTETHSKPTYSFNRLRVLVLDDETDILLATQVYLEALDCVVMSAETIEEALEFAKTDSPELAIIDLRLRDHTSGIDALKAIRGIHPNIPALLVTGDTAPDRLQEASKASAKLLHKPIYSEQLQTAIRNAIQNGTT